MFSLWRFLFLLAATVLAVGCAESGRDHPSGSEEGVEVVAPDLAPPPGEGGGLTLEQALELVRTSDPAEAIHRLDARAFDFPLSEAVLARFRREAPPAVQDYLEKRSKVDWETLRGDVDPKGPK